MVYEHSPPASVSYPILAVVVGLLAIGIFVVDTFILLPDVMAVLYVIVVLQFVDFLLGRASRNAGPCATFQIALRSYQEARP